MKNRILQLLAALCWFAFGAHAATVTSFAPEGEATQVRQIVVKFDQPAVAFGDASAADPVEVTCSLAKPLQGAGHWLNARTWVYDFERELPAGVSCSARLRVGAAGFLGGGLKGAARYAFNTGAPAIQFTQPGEGESIAEDQIFVLRLSGPASAQSIRANVWCAVEGLGERVPVRLVDGKDRDAVIKVNRLEKEASLDPLSVVTLACNRTLPAAAKVQLVFGAGVSGVGPKASALRTAADQRLDFQVRRPFSADLSCQRENSRSGCIPILPIRLTFSAPVPVAMLQAIRMKSGSTDYPAVIEKDFDDQQNAVTANAVRFAVPLAEKASFSIEIPPDLRDDSDRRLSNAGNFPLEVRTGSMPVLAKFAASPFGVVERFSEPQGVGILPLTLRNIEPQLNLKQLPVPASRGQVADLRLDSDPEIIAWYRKVKLYDNALIERSRAQRDSASALPPDAAGSENTVESRAVSLLSGQPGATQIELPGKVEGDVRPFEVIGVPIPAGFHVVELASGKLGQALLDERYGLDRTMFVRSSVLVTNLGVHFKLGRENSVAWVTTLDQGKPVAGATVQVSDCQGRPVAQGVTDENGLARFKGISPQAPACKGDDGYGQAYFVSARARQPKAEFGDAGMIEDLAFTWTDWDRGIEPWRFNVPTSQAPASDIRAHTLLDRSLLRAGETVSMKHILRSETSRGFGRVENPPTRLVITHIGSGQQFESDLTWYDTATGGQSSESRFALPGAAKLGLYQIALAGKQGEVAETGEFRVEEFRLPILSGQVRPASPGPIVHATSLPVAVEVQYVAGGPAAGLPVQVSAAVRDKRVEFPEGEGFVFSPPQTDRPDSADEGQDRSDDQGQKVIASRLALTLDKSGAGKLTLEQIPAASTPKELLLEASYPDPNGEIQTIRSTQTLWPADVVAGIKAENWVSAGKKLKVQALALDPQGKPRANAPLSISAIAHRIESTRKRMVGGFYSYDNRSVSTNLGSVCSGTSDARGVLACVATLDQPGEVELVVTATDASGNRSQAATSVYVTRQGEIWFGGNDSDRMDVLAERKTYQPGDVAKFQVRMPFREATALVAIEREGILESRVVRLTGQDPTISLKVQPHWGPNVYVSVLALRGRLQVVPWYSFFTWGYRSPGRWWSAFNSPDNAQAAPPTALVDLSKPTYRFGMASIRVGDAAHRLNVKVETDKAAYPVRGQARVLVTVTQPGGQPAARAEIALVAVDRALLELMPNKSWNLLEAMLRQRAWGVATSTAQMEIVGRRHYGRKAVPAGGGGGSGATRELFDTLLLWNGRIVLDDKGQAQVTVPLNDSLTTFEIVALADMSLGLFGTGQTSIQSTQDLQIISGLPPLVRTQDRYTAQFTLRNTTRGAMNLRVTARTGGIDLAPRTVAIPANESRQLSWEVTAPAQAAKDPTQAIVWEVGAKDESSGAQDAIKVTQRLVPAVPVTVQQATLAQLAEPLSLPVKLPAGAIAGQGGLKLSLEASLAQGLPGVRTWLLNYPFTCLEQSASRALGLQDHVQWEKVQQQMPGYLDADGLANYFPVRGGDGNRGSDALTAYLLAAANEAQKLDKRFALNPALAQQMLAGLTAFVEGRIERQFWSPRPDLDARKLAAIEALSRYGKAAPKMLESIVIEPKRWPTHAVIDWLNILKRVPGIRQRDRLMAQASQILRERLVYQGTRVMFNNERDDQWWWLMQNGDVNVARLLLTVMGDAKWRDDLAGLATGLIGRQQKGAWSTTTANVWGSLAIREFAAAFEAAPVTGKTVAALGAAQASVDLSAPGDRTMLLPWPAGSGVDTLSVAHQGTGKPWLTVQSMAAVPLAAPRFAGYRIRRSVEPVEQADKSLPAGTYSRGDILRVTLEVNASADMTWVVVADPVPAGATILGNGLGRDSAIASQGERDEGAAWPAYLARSLESFSAYYEYVPSGMLKVQYTMRLNNAGTFSLPPTRVEAMYAPEIFGEAPNRPVRVQ